MPSRIAKLRNEAARRQHHRCCYCDLVMWDGREVSLSRFCRLHGLTRRQARQRRVTAEHLAARADGGRDTRANIKAACLFCNRTRHRSRSPLPPLLYRARRRGRPSGVEDRSKVEGARHDAGKSSTPGI